MTSALISKSAYTYVAHFTDKIPLKSLDRRLKISYLKMMQDHEAGVV